MAHVSFLEPVNASFGAELRLPESFIPSLAHYHLSFSSSAFRREKRSRIWLVQNSKKIEMGHRWKFQCSIQAQLDAPSGGIEVLQASTMEEIYDALAQRILDSASSVPSSSKYIVGMAGPPGAGKSTVAKAVVERLNARWPESNPDVEVDGKVAQNGIAIVVPMDGFHLYRSQLDKMKDPGEAHARRGAPWTFDPDGLIKCLQSIRSQGWVQAPSFDHGVGDPKENNITVTCSHRVIIVEGNYLLLADDKWKILSKMFDERWFLDAEIETTLKRVADRFIALENKCINRELLSGRQGSKSITWKTLKRRSPDEANARVHYNDRKNAETVFKSKVNADLIIKSVDMQKHL